jgi:chromosome segregation ATPase
LTYRTVVHPALSLAAELEARDARVAAELVRVESQQAEVDALRTQAAAAAELLAWLPQAVSENEYAHHQAVRTRDEAAAALRAADDEARPAAEAALRAADADCVRLDEHRLAFARQAEDVRREVERLAQVVGAAGLDDTLETLSHRRGALLVERANLAREREAVVREASELLASVSGDPLTSTSVAGLRERLQRALP